MLYSCNIFLIQGNAVVDLTDCFVLSPARNASRRGLSRPPDYSEVFAELGQTTLNIKVRHSPVAQYHMKQLQYRMMNFLHLVNLHHICVGICTSSEVYANRLIEGGKPLAFV